MTLTYVEAIYYNADNIIIIIISIAIIISRLDLSLRIQVDATPKKQSFYHETNTLILSTNSRKFPQFIVFVNWWLFRSRFEMTASRCTDLLLLCGPIQPCRLVGCDTVTNEGHCCCWHSLVCRVSGVTVSMVAFQAVDPGSTPGWRIFLSLFQLFNFMLELLPQFLLIISADIDVYRQPFHHYLFYTNIVITCLLPEFSRSVHGLFWTESGMKLCPWGQTWIPAR